MNKILQHNQTNNITKLNELINAGETLISDRIGIPLKNTNRNTKPGWEMRWEGQIKINMTTQPEEINQRILAEKGGLTGY